ncbi:MAG: D-alanyl-D-alanine carboxypeptidase family protein [Parachlamydiaceae bacterium]
MQCRWDRCSLLSNCFFLFLLLSDVILAEPLKFHIKGESAILMNAETGAILFDHESSVLKYPASTTKVATALYALTLCEDKLDLSIVAEQDALATLTQEAKRKSNYTTPPYWLEPDGMHIGIKKGEILSLHTLLQGMLIPSGNDAANVIAHALGPTIPTFMEGVNCYLKEIGCLNTYFRNPHGLHDPEHQTTAYDLALIAREALKHPIFCETVSQIRFIRPKTNKQGAATFLQTNRLLRPGKFQYAKAIGGKTGYHAKAKKTFIGVARVDQRTLIVVLLGYQDRDTIFEDAIKLFETAFNQPKVKRIFLKEGSQTFTLDFPKAHSQLKTFLPEPLSLEYYPAEDPQAKCLLYWHSLTLPIAKDQAVAELHLVSSKGEVLKQVPLLALDEVGLAWPYRWFSFFPLLSWWWMLIVPCLTIPLFYCLSKRKE